MSFFSQSRARHIELGRRGEAAAVRFFRRRNCVILARNWRFTTAHDGNGELDIVLLDGETLVFAEVKTLRRAHKYLPGGNLHEKQKRRIRRGARAYCRKFSIPENLEKRFDLVEVMHSGRRVQDIALHENYMSFSLTEVPSGTIL